MKSGKIFIRAAAIIISAVLMLPMFPAEAKSDLTASQECINLIKQVEGFSQYKYWDYSQWTIGYGTGVGADDYPDGITKTEAEALLKKSLKTYEEYVNRFADKYYITLKQNQFDALVSLTYNMGNIWGVYDDFDLKNYVINGSEKHSFLEIAKAFGEWRMAGGSVLQGLVNRREDETKLFLSDRKDSKSEIWRVNTESGINLRKSPSEGSEKTGFLAFNTIYEITEKKMCGGSLWGKTYVNDSWQWGVLDYSKYMVGGPIDYNSTDEPSGKTETWKVTSKNGLNLREGPGLGYKSLGVLDYNTQFKVYMTAEADEHIWGKTQINDKTGWVALTFAELVSKQEFEAAVLNGIYIKTPPKKTKYAEGDMLSLEGIEVMAKYSDGSEKQIVDFSVDGYKSTAGEYDITVTYMEKTAKFKVTVTQKQLRGIEVTIMPKKVLYKEGELLDTEGMIVEATYDNNSREEITDYGLSGFSSDTPGKKTVKVEYKDFSTKFEIEVIEKVMTALLISKLPDKMEYFIGQEINLSGMVVNAVYDNNTKAQIKDYGVTGFESETVGVKKITVSYNEFSKDFDITVVEPDIYQLPGDLNDDGERNIFDLVLLNRFILEGRQEFSAERIDLADINGDGKYDRKDINALSRIVSEQ